MQHITSTVEIPVDKLLAKLNRLIDQEKEAILYEENINLQDFQIVKLSELQIVKDGLRFNLSLKFNLKKDAGLFSVQGYGIINIKCLCHLKQDNKYNIQVQTTLEDYDWVQKPILKMGIIELSIQSISNIIIDYYKKNLPHHIDKSISKSLDIKNLFDNYIKPLSNTLISKSPNVYLNFSLNKIQLYDAYIKESIILLHISFDHSVTLRDSPSPIEIVYPSISLDNTLLINDNILICNTKFSFTSLGKTIINFLKSQKVNGTNIDISELLIQYREKLHILARATQPLKGEISISGNLKFEFDQQSLNLENSEITVKPSNFIYTLLSPVIKSIISNKIEAILPINMKEILNNELNKVDTSNLNIAFGDVSIQKGELIIRSLMFEKDMVEGIIEIPIKSICIHLKNFGES
ncbi:MAG: DUF4403 family protein [Saprospiraceae bacterium]